MVPVNNKITINKQKGTHIMVSANNKLTTTNNIIVLNTQKETNKKKQSIKNKKNSHYGARQYVWLADLTSPCNM